MRGGRLRHRYRMSQIPNRLLLPILISLTAFAKFEHVAKGTIIFAGLLFIASPFPLSRPFACLCVLVVMLLAKTHKAWQEGRAQMEADAQEEAEKEQ